jgi:DNA-binding response OmpR family regulator
MTTDTPKKTVLIIEDDKMLQKALIERFTHEGFAALSAQDGEEGLRIALEKHPHLITIDILMPKMSGIQLMDEIRKDSWGKTVPIIILTNLDSNDKILTKVIEDQPSYYLIKSNTDIEDLISKAKELMGNTAA